MKFNKFKPRCANMKLGNLKSNSLKKTVEFNATLKKLFYIK